MNHFIKSRWDTFLAFAFFTLFLSISYILWPNLPPAAGLSLFVNNIVWLTSVIFVYITILSIVTKGVWIKPVNFLIHLSLVFALVLPFIWSDDITGRGFYRMLGAVFGIIFFLCLFNSFVKQRLWILVLAISLSGFIQAIWGLVQIWIIPESIIPNGTPMGVFQQPNVMATYIVTTFIVSLFLNSIYTVPVKNIEAWINVYINIFAFLTGMLLVLLNSSTAYLTLFISLPLMFLSEKSNLKRIVVILILLLLGCCFALVVNSGLLETLTSGNAKHTSLVIGDTTNSGGRDYIWLICLEMFKENWLTGVGYGNFEHSFMAYQAHYYQQNGIYGFEKLNHPHNEFILWVVEGGILPGIVFIAYTLYILIRMVKMGITALPFAAALIPLVAHALLEYPFYHSAIHWILFVTLLFLFEIQQGNISREEVKYKVPLITLVSVLVLATSLFFITNMHAIIVLNKYNETAFPKRNVQTLSTIINNFTVRPHLNYFAMRSMLERGIRERDKTFVRKSIPILEELNAYEPRPEYYRKLLAAYNFLGDRENFKMKLQEARYYYPLVDYFKNVEGYIEDVEEYFRPAI